MSIKSTNSRSTARVQIGSATTLHQSLPANENLVWNQILFGRRVRELRVAGAASLLASLLKYLEKIDQELEGEVIDEASFDLIRSDLSPISVFLGFDGLSALLLSADMSTLASRARLAASVKQVILECRAYCAKFS